jgi:hypothetical protein
VATKLFFFRLGDLVPLGHFNARLLGTPGAHQVVLNLNYEGPLGGHYVCFFSHLHTTWWPQGGVDVGLPRGLPKTLGGHKVVLMLDYQGDYQKHLVATRWFPPWNTRDHLIDHLRKLGEHLIFFNANFFFLKIYFSLHYFCIFHCLFNIVDHEMKIRFCLMFYV